MSKQWTIENDTGAELTVRAPNGFAVELDANSADPRERFAYFAIRQQARDIAELRERLARPGHSHLDGEHMTGPVDGCLLCQAITERDQLRADLAAAVGRSSSLERTIATLQMRLRRAGQLLIEEIGADGPEAADDTAERAAAVIRNQADAIAALSSQLGNLLAVIHRDGGHYESEHGTEKACADAETAVHVLRGSLEGYVEANRYMKGELDDAIEDARKYAEANGEIVSLRAFAQSVMSAWPYGDVDGGDLQEMAITHGLIVRKDPAPTEPCGDGCECAGMVTAEEFAAGVECYRRTELLTGKSAALAQVAEVGK